MWVGGCNVCTCVRVCVCVCVREIGGGVPFMLVGCAGHHSPNSPFMKRKKNIRLVEIGEVPSIFLNLGTGSFSFSYRWEIGERSKNFGKVLKYART